MRRLRGKSVCDIDPGLSADEFDRIEAEFGLRFADDHRAFLAEGLPVNTRTRPYAYRGRSSAGRGCLWPDWRNGDPALLRATLARPTDGILFDIAKNAFWYAPWGAHPGDTAAALAIARRRLALVPPLIPVYGHRYLPGVPGMTGHPVLSVQQTDLVLYGADLDNYVAHEFGLGALAETAHATADFWKDLV